MTANLMENLGLAGGVPGTVTCCVACGVDWKASAAPGSPTASKDRRLTSFAIAISPGSILIHILNQFRRDGAGCPVYSTRLGLRHWALRFLPRRSTRCTSVLFGVGRYNRLR